MGFGLKTAWPWRGFDVADRVWHKGPPPHVGWWNAAAFGFLDEDMWGWWDGSKWSVFALDQDSACTATERAAKTGAFNGRTEHVMWSDYWPKGSRVPRVDPRNPKKGAE